MLLTVISLKTEASLRLILCVLLSSGSSDLGFNENNCLVLTFRIPIYYLRYNGRRIRGHLLRIVPPVVIGDSVVFERPAGLKERATVCYFGALTLGPIGYLSEPAQKC